MTHKEMLIRAGARAFIPDYRLAPEHPFLAAVPGSIGKLKASAQALDAIGRFVAERLQAPRNTGSRGE